MPKMKTHRGAAKRFRLTKSGKVKRAKAYKSHILTKNLQREREIFEKAHILQLRKKRISGI